MALKRALISELLERRTRNLARVPRIEQTSRRLHALLASLRSLHRNRQVSPPARQELMRYVPIALVAITEGHFKMLYRDLIDSGEPFSSNAIGFKDVKPDIGALLATSRRTISVGEFIASQLPHNNLGQIEEHLSTLLAQDFSAEFTKRLVREDTAVGQKIFQTHLRRFIIETFRDRHIFCHELASRVRLQAGSLETSISVFRVFVHLVEEHVNEFQNPTNA